MQCSSAGVRPLQSNLNEPGKGVKCCNGEAGPSSQEHIGARLYKPLVSLLEPLREQDRLL